MPASAMPAAPGSGITTMSKLLASIVTPLTASPLMIASRVSVWMPRASGSKLDPKMPNDRFWEFCAIEALLNSGMGLV
jgi:hypothetical protein